MGAHAAELGSSCHHMISTAGQRLLVRAAREHAVRPDLAVDDLLRLVNAISLATEQEANRADHADRLLAIVVNGLRHPE